MLCPRFVFCASFAALLLSSAVPCSAGLERGDAMPSYEVVQNTSKRMFPADLSNENSTVVVVFGKLTDRLFWTDLQKLQVFQRKHRRISIIAQVIDSRDAEVIQEMVQRHRLDFPVVVAINDKWDDSAKIRGVSRTIYFSFKNQITWSGIGFDSESLNELRRTVTSASR